MQVTRRLARSLAEAEGVLGVVEGQVVHVAVLHVVQQLAGVPVVMGNALCVEDASVVQWEMGKVGSITEPVSHGSRSSRHVELRVWMRKVLPSPYVRDSMRSTVEVLKAPERSCGSRSLPRAARL